MAERIYLNTLEGGCTLPISVNSQVFNKEDLDTEVNDFEGLQTSQCVLKLHGTVYDRKDHLNFLTHAVQGDLEDYENIAKELANFLRDNGAKDFMNE